MAFYSSIRLDNRAWAAELNLAETDAEALAADWAGAEDDTTPTDSTSGSSAALLEAEAALGELDALVDTVEEEEVKFTLQQNRAEVRCDTMMCRCVHGCMRVCLNPCVCVCCVGCVQHVHDYRSEHAERTAALCAFACIFSRHCEVEPCICMIHNNLICLHVLRA